MCCFTSKEGILVQWIHMHVPLVAIKDYYVTVARVVHTL